MTFRFANIGTLALAIGLLASCGNSDLTIIPKSKINAIAHARETKRESFQVAGPSSHLMSAAIGKPRDKHGMPVYAFSERQRIARTTAYTCSEDDHLVYGSKNAAGTHLRYTDRVRSAAADWSFYPVGTTFRIKGLPHLYVIDDYGSALTGTGTIDIYKPNKETMNIWGRRNVEVQIVQWGSFARSAQILSGRTGFEHCRRMLANIVRQQPSLASVAKR
jgi:3D (Asp-Asp-Asp) domain-containing protein